MITNLHTFRKRERGPFPAHSPEAGEDKDISKREVTEYCSSRAQTKIIKELFANESRVHKVVKSTWDFPQNARLVGHE